MRALLGYLVLASRPVTRSQICELLWDVPNDPRGELRWCLSKIRGLIDEQGRKRVIADGSTIRLDLSDCVVDTLEVTRAPEHGIQKLGVERQQELAALFAGELLEGLEIARSPMFDAWITAERRRFRGIQTVLLENLARALPHEAAAPYLDEWLRLSPFDRSAHELLLTSLARQGRIAEGEAHLAAACKLFEADGLDSAPLRDLWRQRARAEPPRRPSPAHARAGERQPHGDRALRARRAGASTRRASIAVMPFVDRSSEADKRGGAADALAYDVITRLAKLRSMFVIAQGTTFALRDRAIGPEEAGRMLNVDYVVSGSVRRNGRKLTVSADLIETRTARIVWAEVFDEKIDDALDVLDEIGNRIVASVAHEIEMVERNRAILKPPNSLDAWEAHHRGLWHMYRFNKTDNERARQFFAQAVELDPTFARAYAGLSFAHFQNAFLGWKKPAPEIDRAFDAAGKSLMVDDRDPAAHWAMGRAMWLRGGQDQADHRAGTRGRPDAQLRHRALHARVRARAVGRSARRDLVLGPFAPAVAVRSAAVRHARRARRSASRGSGNTRKPPSGPSRPRRVPTRTSTSWPSPRSRSGSPGASRKPTTTRPGSASACPTMRWRTFWRRSATRRTRRRCSSRAASESALFRPADRCRGAAACTPAARLAAWFARTPAAGLSGRAARLRWRSRTARLTLLRRL